MLQCTFEGIILHIVLFLLLTLLIITGCFAMVCAIIKSRKEKKLRQELAMQLKQLRLFKMLSHLGADIDDYIRKLPVNEIENQLRDCFNCEELAKCDTCLRDGKVVFDMNFCPNYRPLIESSKTVANRN